MLPINQTALLLSLSCKFASLYVLYHIGHRSSKISHCVSSTHRGVRFAKLIFLTLTSVPLSNARLALYSGLHVYNLSTRGQHSSSSAFLFAMNYSSFYCNVFNVYNLSTRGLQVLQQKLIYRILMFSSEWKQFSGF